MLTLGSKRARSMGEIPEIFDLSSSNTCEKKKSFQKSMFGALTPILSPKPRSPNTSKKKKILNLIILKVLVLIQGFC